ncbi:MAG: hypothetical protein QM655_02085 [Nocardioidaceae bacterium]
MTRSHEVPPPLLFGLTEGGRAMSELGWFYAAREWLRHGRDGGGRPVLVIPGLNAGDWSTKPLRSLLTEVGYNTYGWGLGTNVGPTRQAISGLDELLVSISSRHDQPVSVIGQSLGGFLGAELARRHVGLVDRLITLGSPMTITSPRQSRAQSEYEKHEALHLAEFAFDKWRRAARPKLPTTSIFSRSDGVVHWHACVYPAGPLTENVEVYSSHLGMGVQPAAVYAVLDRLAVDVANWTPFAAPAKLRGYFPRPQQVAAA